MHRQSQRFHQETIYEFSKVLRYKTNIQKSVLYANDEITESEIKKKTVQFTIASKRIRYLAINPAKDVKGLYSKSYTILKKEIEEDTNK